MEPTHGYFHVTEDLLEGKHGSLVD